MGLERVIQFSAGVPDWGAIKTHLSRIGEPGTLRMIDGLPAFPDEVPEPGWRELRVAAGGGMVTLRRSADALTCIIWSNADPGLLAARDRLAWACAAAGDGAVATDTGSVPAGEFAQRADIRPA